MYKKAWQNILDANCIVVASHTFADGDTLGSSVGLYNILKTLGKKVFLYNATCKDLPREFEFLNSYSKISSKLPKEFDLLITCDCSCIEKLGGLPLGNFKILNIDHHKSNTNFGDINLVEENFSSAGLVVYKLLKENDAKIDKNCAIALYTSIADDTGFFRYGNIDKYCFEAASVLVGCGANPKEIAQSVHSKVSLAKIRLRAYMLNNFVLHSNATIASIIFTEQIQEKFGVKRSDTKNIVSELRDLATVKLAIMILEQDGYIKVSLRSDESIDVSKISLFFDGGGHKSAAGFDVKMDNPEKLLEKILEKVNN